MSLEHLHPFAGQHAIQSAAIAFNFSVELDVGEVARLREAHAELKQDFPIIQDHQRAMVKIAGPVGDASPSTTFDVGGFILERPSSTQQVGGIPLRQIVVSRESVVFVVYDYTRWKAFRGDVQRYMKSLLKTINSQKAISSIGLQFSDAFLWKADPAELDLSEVFMGGSQFLAPNALNPDSLLWHSHHGYLIDAAGPPYHQQLNNINISRNIVAGEHRIEVLTSHKSSFPKPMYKILDVNNDKVFGVLDLLHGKNKEILASLLSKELQRKICLDGRED